MILSNENKNICCLVDITNILADKHLCVYIIFINNEYLSILLKITGIFLYSIKKFVFIFHIKKY